MLTKDCSAIVIHVLQLTRATLGEPGSLNPSWQVAEPGGDPGRLTPEPTFLASHLLGNAALDQSVLYFFLEAGNN